MGVFLAQNVLAWGLAESYLHLLAFLYTDIAQVAGILSRGRQAFVYVAESITYLLMARAPSQYKDRLIYVWRFPC